jgi:hypothetical protein
VQKARIALILVLIPCILPRLRHPFITGDLVDFGPYYTAATLARDHQGIGIYSGADTGLDPQNVLADSSTLFAKTASRIGVQRPFLYLYPPILADMLIPLTFFPFGTARTIWVVLNYAMLPLTSLFIVRLLNLRLISWGSLIVLTVLYSFSPVIQCINMGQVSILLLLLWASGTLFHVKGWHVASGFAFALAAAIKLTPLIVVLPLLLLKEWKTLRAFFISLLFLAAVTCFINTPASLTDYFVRVVPPMSRGILTVINISTSASVERLYVALHHGVISPAVTNQIPAALIWLGKGLDAVILCVAGLLIYSRGHAIGTADRTIALALFAVLSVCVAPVSWQHGCTLCFLALSLLWVEALREPKSNLYLIILIFGTITQTTSLNEFAYRNLDGHAARPILAALLLSVTPIGGIVLVLTRLVAIRQFQQSCRIDPSIDSG